jgi:CheY-like chemotaxis protein
MKAPRPSTSATAAARPVDRRTDGNELANLAREFADEPRLDGVRVLVVDDARVVLEVVTEILQLVGATVTAVRSAEAALTALQSERPDVLLSDISMPGKDGYWLIDQVRALPAERGGATPAIALTAETALEHSTRALRAGFQVHVAKPVGVLELVGIVAGFNGHR